MFVTGTTEPLQAVPNTIAQVDDTYVYDLDPAKAMHDAARLVEILEKDCGLKNRIDKTQIFTPQVFDLENIPHAIKGAEIVGITKGGKVSAIAKFLGTFTIVNPEVNPKRVTTLLEQGFNERIQKRFGKKINKIATMDALKQFLKRPEWPMDFFKDTDMLSLDTALQIIGIPQDQTTQVQIFKPLVHGGFGILPYTQLATTMHHQSFIDSAPFLSKKKISHAGISDQKIDCSSLYQWKKWSSQSTLSLGYSPTHSKSWISIWPTNSITRLSDDHFDFISRLQLNCLVPRHYLCPLIQADIGDLTPALYTDHVLSCKHCAAHLFTARHENINNSIHHTLKYHGIYSTINPKNLPRPGNSRGGPDLIIYSNDISAVDVSVCDTNKTHV